MAPPPPRPFIQGSSTPSAMPVAITASTQSPPAASTSAPISAALRACAATMPPFDETAGFRICWLSEKLSDMFVIIAFVTGPIVKPPSTKTSREREGLGRLTYRAMPPKLNPSGRGQTMPFANNQGVRIYYETVGQG